MNSLRYYSTTRLWSLPTLLSIPSSGLSHCTLRFNFSRQLKTFINMDEKDFPSSDESDADFVPKEEDYKSDSGSEILDSDASEGEEKTSKSRKRKKGGRKSNKKAKTSKHEEEEEEEDKEEDSESKEDKKIDVDALWADFKKDVNSTETKKTVDSSNTNSNVETGNKSSESLQNLNEKTSKTCTAKAVPNFPNKNKVGGLSKVLNQIGKKDKMSTLQKSQLDWNKFKKIEGIEEEIKTHNKGKDGYLEKQDFLQRTDLRQFEIEKDMRSTRRKF